MKIQFNTLFAGNAGQVQKQNSLNANYYATSISPMNELKSDMFVKSANNVSFTGDVKDKIRDVAEDLAAIGIVGAPLVLSVAAGAHFINHTYSDDIFYPDGTYMCSIDDLKSDTITANANEGIIKIEGTPVDIDASRYDFADVENGVFKNFDGSVDIDLANNKYIDMEHGVFIDPDSKVSFIRNAEGVMENVAIPDVGHVNFKGAPVINGGGGSRGVTEVYPPTRSQYIAKHGYAPEDSPEVPNLHPKIDLLGKNHNYRIAVPDDNRTTTQKLSDYFNIFQEKSARPHDHTKAYDIFGREIVTMTDAHGSTYKIGLDEGLKAVMDKYHLKGESLGELANFFDQIKLKKYILEYHPGADVKLNYHHETMADFIQRLTDSHSGIGHAVEPAVTDAVATAVDAATDAATHVDTEVHHSLMDAFLEMLGNHA